MPYAYPGNPALGKAIAEAANAAGVKSRAHDATTLELEYGTLVPMRYMNADRHFKVVSVSAWCMWHKLDESLALRRRRAPRDRGELRRHGGGVRQRLAVSHHFADNGTAPEFMHRIYDPFLEQVDRRVVELWQRGEWATFVDMLPMYADKCWGEGGMHDTAMLMGLLGGRDYAAPAEVITPYFGSSGTGQINAVLPVTAP